MAPSPCGASAVRERHGQRKPPTRPHHSRALPFLPCRTVRKARLPHLVAQRAAREKTLERCNHVVYSAPQVSFATSCLPRTEKSQTPTQASIISMREKLGTEMAAGSLDILPHTHSFALNAQEFKPVPNKKNSS